RRGERRRRLELARHLGRPLAHHPQLALEPRALLAHERGVASRDLRELALVLGAPALGMELDALGLVARAQRLGPRDLEIGEELLDGLLLLARELARALDDLRRESEALGHAQRRRRARHAHA